MASIPAAPPPPPPPTQCSLLPEILEDDEFTEKRYQKELQFHIVSAIEKGKVDLVRELIEKGVNTNAIILLVKTPLIHALEQYTSNLEAHMIEHYAQNLTSIISALVNAPGTDINLGESTPWGKKPLHYVVSTGSVELLTVFLDGSKKGFCDVNVRDKGGASPLHYAARFGHQKVVELLLEHNCDINAKDDCGRTALHRACEYQHIHVAKTLIDHGLSMNVTDNFLWSPIFHAILFGHISVVQFLVELGADVQVTDKYGQSLLHVACYNKLSDMHSKHYPEVVTLATSFNYYERKRRIPSTEFQDLLLLTLDDKIIYEDFWMFVIVEMLLNAGVDPKVYPTDDIYCQEMSVLGKTRAYLILTGSMLPFDDFLFQTDDEEGQDKWRSNWFKQQQHEQLSLQRQCRYTIRKCLAHTRDISLAISHLPVPAKLKSIIRPDEDFERFLTITDDGGPYEEILYGFR